MPPCHGCADAISSLHDGRIADHRLNPSPGAGRLDALLGGGRSDPQSDGRSAVLALAFAAPIGGPVPLPPPSHQRARARLVITHSVFGADSDFVK
jgi:hypothetical protein